MIKILFICHGRMCQIWKKDCTSRIFALQHPFYQRFTNIGESQTCKIYTDGRNSFGGWMRKISITIWANCREKFSSICLWFCITEFDWIPIELPIDPKWIGGQFLCKIYVFCNRKRMGCIGYFLLKFMNHFYTDVYSTIYVEIYSKCRYNNNNYVRNSTVPRTIYLR